MWFQISSTVSNVSPQKQVNAISQSTLMAADPLSLLPVPCEEGPLEKRVRNRYRGLHVTDATFLRTRCENILCLEVHRRWLLSKKLGDVGNWRVHEELAFTRGKVETGTVTCEQ